jgi:hypothetical protein
MLGRITPAIRRKPEPDSPRGCVMGRRLDHGSSSRKAELLTGLQNQTQPDPTKPVEREPDFLADWASWCVPQQSPGKYDHWGASS